jgi:hypothetical protein
MITAVDMQEARAAAAVRKQERLNHYETYTDAEKLRARLEGRTLPRMDMYADIFAGPASPSQFFDDRLIEWGQITWDPAGPVLVAIADAAREGAGPAVQAVRAARKLDHQAQWAVYQNLMRWKRDSNAAKVGAEPVINAVLDEWSRLGLAELHPADPRAHMLASRRGHIDGD